MIRRLITIAHRNKSITSPEPNANQAAALQDEKELKAQIEGLFQLSRRGLWGLLIFLAASAIALYFREHTLTGSLPAGLMDQLGPTPPVILVNIVLVVSTLCSLIIIAGRIHGSRRPGNTWTHLWFRLFFYLLYFIADALNSHFNAVFISGLAVIALQHYNIWNYYSRVIEMKMSIWEHLTTCNRGVAGE